MSKNRLAKNISIMSVSVFLSRILGLIRDQVMAYFFGTTFYNDAFNAAFNLPNLLRRLFGEGALSAAFVPIYNEIGVKKSKKEQYNFALNVMSLLSAFLLILTGLGVLLAPYLIKLFFPGFDAGTSELTVSLTRILFPYLFCIGLSSTMIAILNSHDKFFMTGLSSGLLNIGWMAFLIIPRLMGIESNYLLVHYASYGVLVGGVLQILINIPFLIKLGYHFKLSLKITGEAISALWRRFIPGVIGIGVRQLNLIADNLMASFLQTGSITALMYGNRLMQLPLGIFGIATSTAVLPMFSRYVVEEKWKELSDSLRFAILSLANIMIPIAVLLIGLGEDIITVLFKRGEFDTQAVSMTYFALMFYSIGLLFFSINQTLIPLFYANKDTKTPVILASFMVVLNISLNYVLMQFMGHGGLALSTTVTAIVNCTILLLLIKKRYKFIKFSGIALNIIKALGLSGLLFVLVNFLTSLYNPQSIWLLFAKVGAISIVTVALYITLATLMKIDYADYAVKRLWQRFRKN